MNIQTLKKAAVSVSLLGLSAIVATATPITGSFSFAGAARVTQTSLDFFPVGTGTGQVVTTPGANTGNFASLNGGVFTPVTITDRTDASQPVGVALNVPNYIQLSAFPTYQFTLEYILPGQYSSAQCFVAPANQQTCTVPPAASGSVSPYNLTNFIDANGTLSSTASFSVRGRVIDTTSPADINTFEGVFNATFLNTPYQTTLNTVLGGGSIDVPFSATISVAPVVIPEPSSILLGLSGLAMVAFVRRRK